MTFKDLPVGTLYLMGSRCNPEQPVSKAVRVKVDDSHSRRHESADEKFPADPRQPVIPVEQFA